MLEDIRRYLQITYEDEDTDQVLRGLIGRGKQIIDDYAGTPQDYDSEGMARQLLFDYVRYGRSHALEMFEINFRRDLIALRELAEEKMNENQDTD